MGAIDANAYLSRPGPRIVDGAELLAAILHPDVPATGMRRRILFQLVPEGKTVKNRLHLDVRIGADKVEDELARLTAAGATFLHRGRQGPHGWITLADPEGNEFCIN